MYGKGVACNDELADECHPTLKLPSATRSILVSFNSLFWFYNPLLWQNNGQSTTCTVPDGRKTTQRERQRESLLPGPPKKCIFSDLKSM